MKANYPDSLTIQQYLQGKLDSEMMHQLEKQALDDPFLWEALEGFSHSSDPGRDLSILQRQLHERIVHLQENKKVFDLTWQRLSVAAAAAVLFIAAGILFWMNSPQPNSNKVSGQKQVEVRLTHPDSIKSVTKSPSVAVTVPQTITQGSQVPVALSPHEIVQPVGGWQHYQEYLKQNARHPKNHASLRGTVLLSFQVEKDGQLSDIKVVKGLSDFYDKEAIRLVRKGPSWKGAADGLTKEISLEIPF